FHLDHSQRGSASRLVARPCCFPCWRFRHTNRKQTHRLCVPRTQQPSAVLPAPLKHLVGVHPRAPAPPAPLIPLPPTSVRRSAVSPRPPIAVALAPAEQPPDPKCPRIPQVDTSECAHFGHH